jgi:galactose mutarotase-like enzyme
VARQGFVDGVCVIRLTDAVRKMEVSILRSIGNTAYELTVRGKNILFFPDAKFADLTKNPMQLGIPFMAPWANRLDASTCIEPMAGITNAINLNHAGKYSELQTVPGNGKWTASFWVRPKGF